MRFSIVCSRSYRSYWYDERLAQAPQGGPPGGRGAAAGQVVEKIRELKPNLYMITGGGANTLVRVTPEGSIVVDTKNPGRRELQAA